MNCEHILVAVLFYNKTALTETCLHSLVASGIPDSQIIAVDNGSEASTISHLRDAFPTITFIRQNDNRGFSGGFNFAAKHFLESSFEGMLFITNDVLYQAGTLESIAAEQNGVFQVPLIYHARQREKIDSFGAKVNWQKYTVNHLRQLTLAKTLNPLDEYAPGTAFYIEKTVLNKIGMMDESYNTYWEDIDFSIKAHRAGIPITRNPDAVLFHGIGKTCHKKPYYTLFLFQRNRLKFFETHLSQAEFDQAKIVIKKDLDALYQKYKNINAYRTELLVNIYADYFKWNN